MSGVALPPVPGTVRMTTTRMSTPDCNSRPSSASSTHSTTFTNVPHVYFNNYTRNSTSRSFSRTPRRLPSLKHPRGIHSSQLESVSARYSAKYRRTPGIACRLSANSPFLPRSSTADCLKCLLRVPHRKCESHKYIRVGGGYRHGYWYVKCLLEELELQRRKEALRLQRLDVIKEKTVKAIKTYVRTKSGRLIEKIIFLSEEDYEAFKEGKGIQDILKKYLTKEEAEGLESWDKDEVKAITTFVRTKSGRLIEKLVYVSKEEYDDIKSGKVDAKDILQKYVKTEDGEVIEGWGEAKMRTIKTHVRTKSGRLIEKVIMISEEDYNAMVRDGKDPAEILAKYISLEEGQTLDSWQSAEPMKAIKTMVRTKSGRLVEKTIYVSADDYERMIKGGGDPKDILKKYMGDDAGEIESWHKASDEKPMKVVKTFVRTKSGRLIEKTVLLTEDEYRQFVDSGGDPDLLRKFMDLAQGETIEDWEKASTVYSLGSDDEEVKNAKPGERVVGKDGVVYEIVVDPITGKKYKKRVLHPDSDVDSGIASMHRGKKGKGGRGEAGIAEEESAKERLRRKIGKRDEASDSDYSYKSFTSDGGTRHVKRRKKRADGTYSASESYHSSQDEDGAARRRRRRRERKHGPDSAHSYHSYVSEGGTRHVKRKKKRADGTYSASESYHSSDSDLPGGRRATKKKKEKAARKKLKEREHGSGSEHSYYSEVSEGGTRTRKRKKRIRDEHGNVIGYAASEKYSSPDISDDESVYTEVSDGKGGKMLVKKAKPKGKKGKKGRKDSGPVFSDESSSDDDVDLENMTEEEKKQYFEAKAKRKLEREERRKKKYGDKYEEMLKKHEKKKADKVERRKLGYASDESSVYDETGKRIPKSMVSYEKGSRRGLLDQVDKTDGRGLSNMDDWSGKKGKKKGKTDGNEADDESDEGSDTADGKKKKKSKMRPGSDPDFLYEYDEQGRVIRKKRIKAKDGDDGSGSEYEFEYDDKGRLIKQKRVNAKGDGDESGSEVEYEYDEEGNLIKQKRILKKAGGEQIEFEYDAEGRIIRQRRINKQGDGQGSGSEYEYEYDEHGNLKGKKKIERHPSAESDGDYFEVDEKGEIKLKHGKKKIDLSKLTHDDLRKLGIDPNLSKQEIARQLQERFGIRVVDKGKKIGTKRLEDYGSNADTDELANDSDLDITTLKGTRRVNVLMRRGGQTLLDHIKRLLNESRLQDDYPKDLDERGDIDFLAHYRLVDKNRLESYARAFGVEDDDLDTILTADETRTALEGVPSIQQITEKQMDYVLKVLKIDDASQITFRMFAVISALSERVTQMDPLAKRLMEICDLLDIQRKMDLYQSMFYWNVNSDRDTNFIKADSLRIELIAGGLNWKQQEYIMERLQPNNYNEISFLDYICYIPLFLSMHDNIVNNPLDMSNNKYDALLRRPSGQSRQRDINPLGQPLSKKSSFQMRQQAQELLEGKITMDDVNKDNRDLINKYKKLPKILESSANPEGKEFVDKDGTVYQQHVDEEGNIYIMKKDPKTGKMVKTVVGVKKPKKNKLLTRKDGKAFTKPSAMTEEQLLQFKTGKRMTDSDSEYSYRSVYSAGGTRNVRRRRRLSGGKYSGSESYDSERDQDGKTRRLKRRDVREKERVKEEKREKDAKAKREKALAGDRKQMGSAASYYSYVSDGGTRHVKKKGRQREDGTYSDDESMAGDYKYDKTKKKRAIKDFKKKPMETPEQTKKKPPGAEVSELTPRTQGEPIHTTPVAGGGGADGEEDLDREYSFHSEVSEGGTRRVFKKKKILDEQGNVVGYGDKELVDADSDEESVRIRRGLKYHEHPKPVYFSDAAEMKASKELFKQLQEMIGDDDSGSKVGPGGVRMVQGSDGKWYPVKSKDAKGIDDLDIPSLDMPKSSIIDTDADGVPLDFSDDSEDEPDLSHMTEEEKKQYYEARDKRRAERESRMRAKYGDKYEEMMRLRKLQKEKENAERQKRQEEADAKSKALLEAAKAAEEDKHPKITEKLIRRTSSSLLPRTPKKPKSMVSYQTGSARDISGPITKSDSRNLGPGHDEWSKKGKTRQLHSPAKRVQDTYDPFNFKPIKLPIILQGKELDHPDTVDASRSRSRKGKGGIDGRKSQNDEVGDKAGINMDLFEIGEDGKLRLKEGVTIDLSRLSSATLRQLGIDPNLSKEELIKQIQQKLGTNVVIKDGDKVIKTWSSTNLDLEKLASTVPTADEDGKLTYRGRRRVNLLMQRGGQVLLNHMKRILDMCNTLKEDYAKNLDEKDGSINFLAHYRLVEPGKLESYAKAFVVEDRNMDTVINFDETKIALDGVPDLEYMTNKQADYVLKVLHIDDASMVTFRMFAVITALCERVTRMDTISKKLLELCNLADIERKLELYKSMFYHNVSSDRVANFITAESLKIELIAGGLNWKQQNYIMDKMEPNSWGEISFLDYMCYIPLFLSLHDNIIANPFDMSDEKYVMPPRKRPPSPQRDMNPLGQPLSKKSSFLMKKQARDYVEGKLGDQMVGDESLDKIQLYSKMTDIDTFDKPVTSTPVESDSDYEKIDLIY
ncbi:uncharacterized protein LOC121368836 [Gigantopelta aegis]|uniref:uncharacterized protein LOC121368836 n=1 Tax=Gigantopelta aegis TaxID=1735272 RepID=UPI001B88D235|nr:uncharacterized protein LOC121368836 [Gigantopelta aegis]